MGLALVATVVAGGLMLTPSPAASADDLRVAGMLTATADGGTLLRLDDRRYHDTIELRAAPDGSVVVNELGIERYVEGVAEMPGRWAPEALKAQAIAARTYAWHSLELGSFDGYDICATVACQVFRGAETVLDEAGGDRWQRAVQDTAGQVLVDEDGAPILARYFSTSGGRTYANEEAFPGSGPRPYLVAIEDPDDAVSPYHRWTARFTREQFDDVLSRGETLAATVPVADVERIGPADDPNARVRVVGQDGTSVEVGARELADFLSRVAPQRYPDEYPQRRSDGLRPLPTTVPSSRFAPEVTGDEVVLQGQGWGHGVGLGQYGARGRAERGQDHREILAAYYNGLEPVPADDLPARIRVGWERGEELRIGADGAFRLTAGDQVIAERTLGTWTAVRAGDGWQLTPPDGHTDPLEVAATRLAPGITVDDAVVVETDVNKPVLLRLEVVATDGRTVTVRELGTAEPGTHAATWRFDDVEGRDVPAGDYLVTLVAEDAQGTTAGDGVEVQVAASALDTIGSVLDDPATSVGSRSLLLVGVVGVFAVGVALALVQVRRRSS
jgi:SpoIID/LytB domain protein